MADHRTPPPPILRPQEGTTLPTRESQAPPPLNCRYGAPHGGVQHDLPVGLQKRHPRPEVSLSSLYGSSTALYSTLFGCLIARNKLVSSSLNAAFLALAAAVVVAFEFEPNRDDENTAAAYLLGLFVFDVPVSLLRGLVLALSERVLADVLGRRGSSSFHTVLVLQAVVSLFAFAFSSIGFFAGGGFGEMRDGAARATDGKGSYYMVICWTAVAFQVAALAGFSHEINRHTDYEYLDKNLIGWLMIHVIQTIVIL